MPHITRRHALITTALGAAAATLSAGRASAQTTRPNILFIMADDLGYGDLSCYGHPEIKTPRLDSLAAGGARLTQAYANSPVCSATRTALITGRYQYRLRLGLEEPLLNPNEDVGLPAEVPTLPSLLQKAGYSTMLIGKWHLGMLPKYDPRKSGYEHFYGMRGGAVDYYTHLASTRKPDLWDDDREVSHPGYLTELLATRAVDAIGGYAKARKPFFMSLHFTAPHWPWEAPGDEAEAERLRTRSLFHFDGGTPEIFRKMVESLDTQVGRVLDALRANGLDKNTLVVFTSDNGGERFSYTYPFTGRKTELLEGGLRIPAIVAWPGRVAAGGTNTQVVASMDWMPTLLAAAGAKPDAKSAPDGENLLPQLTGAAQPTSRKLYWRYKSNAQRAMLDGHFKFLKIMDNTFLFDIAADPMERANLKERHADVFARMQNEWRAWNAGMLPEIDESYVESFTSNQLADHIGSTAPSKKANPAD
jgi:arylsulfatase A-like enzyme